MAMSTSRVVAMLIWVLSSTLLQVAPISAQEAADTRSELTYSEQASAFEEQIQQSLTQISQLETRREGRQGPAAWVFDQRIETETREALEQAHKLAQLVIAREAAGENPEPFRAIATQWLTSIPENIKRYANGLSETEDLNLDISALSATEQIALVAKQEQLSMRLLAMYSTLLRNLELSEQLGLNTREQAGFIDQALIDATANQSVLLEIAREYGKTLDRQVRALPQDAELAALDRVDSGRVKWLSDILRQLVQMMEQRGISVVEYRQQLVSVTGAATTDILNVDVFAGLTKGWLQSAGAWSTANLPGILFNLVLCLLILWAALALSSFTRRLIYGVLNRTPSNMTQLLRRMIASIAGHIVLALGLLFGLAQLGISVAPLLAGLGIAGFIIGFALQDTLGNFASGMMILIYRPYDVGDMIETGGVLGKVSHMSLVNTTVLSIDNQTLVLPNSKIWGDVIKNITAQRERRVDMLFGIGYGDDIPKAEQVLSDIVHSHSKVLDAPAPVVRLHTLNESSMDFIVRPWVKTEDYWDVYWDITRAVKMHFDEAGISIPFPQHDIHVFTGGDKGASKSSVRANLEQPPVPPSGAPAHSDAQSDAPA